ncbi:MAG: pentapeptide repeat-containing protein [Planctomycetota bacterium]|nr:pentapeptide repeat-containing protein [Planctomycetota bacterium]
MKQAASQVRQNNSRLPALHPGQDPSSECRGSTTAPGQAASLPVDNRHDSCRRLARACTLPDETHNAVQIRSREFPSPPNLSRANLSRANLSRANLSRANLSRANLSRANLSRARVRIHARRTEPVRVPPQDAHDETPLSTGYG